MTNKRKPYKTFSREFKLEAIRLMKESDRPSTEVAAELGIRRNQLYKRCNFSDTLIIMLLKYPADKAPWRVCK